MKYKKFTPHRFVYFHDLERNPFWYKCLQYDNDYNICCEIIIDNKCYYLDKICFNTNNKCYRYRFSKIINEYQAVMYYFNENFDFEHKTIEYV